MTPASLTLAITELVVSTAWVLALAMLAGAYLPIRRRALNSLCLLVLCVLFLTGLTLLAGFAGVLNPHVVASISLLGLLVLVAVSHARLLDVLREMRQGLRALWPASRSGRAWMVGLSMLWAIILLRHAAHIWYLPPYIWDVNSYHLPKVADWIQEGRLVALDTPVRRSFWPAGFELIQTWCVLFFHHDVIVEAAGLPFYLLAVGSVYSIGRSLDMSRRISAAMATAYGLTPALMLHAVSCKNDMAIAALFLFIAAVALDFRRHGDRPWEHAVMAVLALALAAGIKPYIAFLAPGLALLGGWCAWIRPHTQAPEGGVSRGWVAGLVLLAAVVGGFWYVRNIVTFRNPVYPAELRVGKHVLARGVPSEGQQGRFALTSLTGSLHALVSRKIYDSEGPYTPDLGNTSGWGWFVFACGIPALGLALLRSAEFRWIAAAFGLSLVLLLGFVSNDPWNMRFALWFPALLVIGFFVSIQCVTVRPVLWGLGCLAVACSLLNFVATLGTGYHRVEDWRTYAATPVWDRKLVLSDEMGAGLWKVRNATVLGYFSSGNAWVYPLYGPDLKRRIRYLPLGHGRDVVRQMKDAGVQTLFLFDVDEGWRKVMDSAAEGGAIRALGRGGYVLESPDGS